MNGCPNAPRAPCTCTEHIYVLPSGRYWRLWKVEAMSRPANATMIEARLDTYAELRGRHKSRRECAERMGMSVNSLHRFLARHRDDPRSDAIHASSNAHNPDHNRPVARIDMDPETIRLAQLTVCARLGMSEARTVLDMLGIAS